MLNINKDYPLKTHNSFGLDVKAKYFVEYETADDLISFLTNDSNSRTLELFHLGSGSDLLFTKDFDGCILHSAVKGIDILDQSDDHVTLSVGAAENWDHFVQWTIDHGYYGLENLSLIPSEVGAAAVQNIGAYGAEAQDYILCVDCVDMRTATTVRHNKGQCGFGYRRSNYKEQWRGQYAIIRVHFTLPTHFTPNISYNGLRDLPTDHLTAEDVRRRVIELRRSKLPDPSELGNAGSFFLNPIITAEHYATLRRQYPDIPNYPVSSTSSPSKRGPLWGNGDDGSRSEGMPDRAGAYEKSSPHRGGLVKVPAAWLIEKAGWKGKTLGRAGVYHRQPLVLVNLGGATPHDIVTLADAIINDVRQQFDISLIPEVIYL